jgi:hypothetical protein
MAKYRPSIPAGSDDTELLALGPKLEEMATEWIAQVIADRQRHETFLAEFLAATGITHDEGRDMLHSDSDEGTEKYHSIVRSLPSYTDEEGPWDDIHARLWAVLDRVIAQKAFTTQGLAIQAVAASLAVSELWDGECQNHDDDCVRGFIENARRCLGVVPVPLRLVESLSWQTIRSITRDLG